MSKLLGFFFSSVLVTLFTLAFLFFLALHFILKAGDFSVCIWQGSAKAWIDTNADGRIDHNEPPLRGVKIHVDKVQHRIPDISWPLITHKNGEVQFNVSIPQCSNTLYEIYVDIPHGYKMTTRPRIEVTPNMETSLGKQHIYYFGFVPAK
jgi:hypothetical protein